MSTGNVQTTAPSTPAYSSPPITIVLTIIVLAFFFIGFFSFYICRFLMQNLVWTWHLRNGTTHVGPSHPSNFLGLDPKIIQSFPTFLYSNIKDYRKEKYGLECAICLVEFGNDDIIRLLTSCCHVFHQECIDLWLGSHNTCPVCRKSLDSSPDKSQALHERSETTSTTTTNESFVVVSIKDEENEDDENSELHDQPSGLSDHVKVDQGQYGNNLGRISRSHSTGHSVVEENHDKFTLRLPEHVKAKIVKGHISTRSCINFGDIGGDHINRLV